ncbi:MAG: AMP-binding protein, partial [bacterium]|nr:AMP-binding protein [bacterium]
GIAGELCIAGVGLARGYLNRPQLTAERFVNFPHSPTHPLTHSTIYRTGDLARWLPDGNIEFLGRIDYQVKIRGFRIELGEIENRLISHEAVKETAVITREDEKGNYFLCAYYVPINSGEELQVPALREFLSRELPGYMIPSYFVSLESMPLTGSNKIDRKALPEPEGLRAQVGTAYLVPQTELEKKIAETWMKVLNIDKVGIHDNFFELGGNSLKIVQLNMQLKEDLGKDIPVVLMYRHLTVSSFAHYLMEKEREAVSSVEGKRRNQSEEALSRAKNLFKHAVKKTRKQVM